MFHRWLQASSRPAVAYYFSNRWVSFALPTLRTSRPSTRNPFGLVLRRLLVRTHANKQSVSLPLLHTLQTTRSRIPFRRPSVCVAQGDARQDAERGVKGQGPPFATAPGVTPEGAEFCAAKPGCRGGLLFGYFFLATQEKVTRRARRNLQSQPRKAQRLTTLRTPPSTIQARILSKALCALRGAPQSAATIPPHLTNPTPLLPIGSGPPFCINPEAATPPSRGEHS